MSGLQKSCVFDNRTLIRIAHDRKSQLAEQIGLSRAVARRSLLTLQYLGYDGHASRVLVTMCVGVGQGVALALERV